MTHTSTEQPEALRLAELIETGSRRSGDSAIAAELRRLHAHAQELEAERTARMTQNDRMAERIAELEDQVQRAPLTDAQIKEGRNAVNDDPDDRPEPWAFREGVKFAERMHGIKE